MLVMMIILYGETFKAVTVTCYLYSLIHLWVYQQLGQRPQRLHFEHFPELSEKKLLNVKKGMHIAGKVYLYR